VGRSTSSSVSVLFTSAGRRVELLRAFRRAYQKLGLTGRLVATDIDPLAPALREADVAYIVPRIDSPDYISALQHISEADAISLVIPLIDPDVRKISQHIRDIQETGARPLVVGDEASRIAEDKVLSVRLFESLGLAAPTTWVAEEVDARSVEYPVFVKPRRGSAGKNAYRADSRRELEFFLEYVPDPIVQELLAGPEVTTDVVCSAQGEVLGAVSRRRIEVRWGEVQKGVTIRDPRVLDGARAIALALGAIGPLTVQCMYRSGQPCFTEVNARYGGGAPLGIAAGVDSPTWFLAEAAGLDCDIPPFGAYRTGLCLTRYDDSFFLTEQECENMARRVVRP